VRPRPSLEHSRDTHRRASDERFALGAAAPLLAVRDLP
jgi:hypothetical protein